MEYFVVACYCTCIIEILRYFFIQQSLTTSKMRKFQTLKLSQFHKAKNCWTENWWSSGIMSNFFWEFFLCFWGQKSCINEVKKCFYDTWKKIFNLNWIYLHKIFVMMYSIPYTRGSNSKHSFYLFTEIVSFFFTEFWLHMAIF